MCSEGHSIYIIISAKILRFIRLQHCFRKMYRELWSSSCIGYFLLLILSNWLPKQLQVNMLSIFRLKSNGCYDFEKRTVSKNKFFYSFVTFCYFSHLIAYSQRRERSHPLSIQLYCSLRCCFIFQIVFVWL